MYRRPQDFGKNILVGLDHITDAERIFSSSVVSGAFSTGLLWKPKHCIHGIKSKTEQAESPKPIQVLMVTMNASGKRRYCS